jgi:phenylalanyl-tRNA synthetase beta chain
MRVPVSWLKDFVDIDLSIEALAELLTIAGMEVEYIHYIGIPGGYDKERLLWDPTKLVMSQVLSVEQHPNADKLVLATVDYGADEHEVVVTGAPNLKPFLGQGDLTAQGIYSPLALEGAEIYDGHKEGLVKSKLKGRALRGIHNRCMLCSEKELGISDEHEGIMLLDEGTPGAPLTEVLGDAIFEIDIIPNIARCASMLGIAREIAALTDKPLRLPDTDVERNGTTIEGKVAIRTESPELNPRFTATLIEGVTLGTSPEWMQRRLRLAGLRPINVVVDISNYVMLEVGQPNHTFDYDFLKQRANEYAPDGPIELITRLPNEGETLTTLDGTTHQLRDFNMVVADPKGVLSLGGIMGGADSEIADTTTNVLLESASWNFMNIRRSASALKIGTDAGFRFSRGVHPSQAMFGALRVAKLLHDLTGGTVSQDTVDMIAQEHVDPTLPLTPQDVKRIAGIDLSAKEIGELLERLSFGIEYKDDHILATAPNFRLDIAGTQDLVEEVCRAYGYDNIPTTEMADPLPQQRTNTPLLQEEFVKNLLVDLHFQEVMTYRLTSPEREAKLDANAIREAREAEANATEGEAKPAKANETDNTDTTSDVVQAVDTEGYIAMANPLSVDKTVMRRSVLTSVLEIVAQNSRFQEHMSLFEWGKAYLPGHDGGHPIEHRRLALVMTGQRQATHWQDQHAPGEVDFFDLKGVLEAIFTACHIPSWTIAATEHPSFRPGRTASITICKRDIGVFGEVHPLVVDELDIRCSSAVLAADLDLEALLPLLEPAFKVEAIPAFPSVQEDIAILVDRSLPAAEIEDTIQKAGGFLLKDIELFDLYEGEQIPASKRSLAYHLTFQSPKKTLRDKDVKKCRDKIIKQLEKDLGAILR